MPAPSVWPAIVSVTPDAGRWRPRTSRPPLSKATLNLPVKLDARDVDRRPRRMKLAVTSPFVAPAGVAKAKMPSSTVTATSRERAGAQRDLAVLDLELGRRGGLGEREVAGDRHARERERDACAGDAQLRRRLDRELGVEAVERERLVDVVRAVVLSSRPSVPASVTLGTFCSATVPLRPCRPRRRPPARGSSPSRCVSVTRSCVPSPSARLRLAMRELDRRAVVGRELLDGDVRAQPLGADAQLHPVASTEVRALREVEHGRAGRVQREREACR